MKSHLRRSDTNPSLYYIYSITPNGNPTRQVEYRSDHLRWSLQRMGVPADEVAKLLAMAPGHDEWFEV
jgi:hypothetical protein